MNGMITVQPPEFVVELQRGKESRSPLVLGTPVLVAHAAITGEGEVPLGLHAEFRSTVLDIPVRLGWDQDLRDKLSVAPEVPTDGLVYAMAKVPTNMSAKMVGRRITGELVVTATSDSDPKVRVRLRDQGHDVTAFPLEFEVKGWTLRIIYKGTDCTRLPPKQRTWIQIDKANQVLPMATALREPLGVEFENPGATTMPEDIAERTIAAKVVDPSGTVQAAGFELEGESKPVWLVKVRDLDRVRDIVLVGGTGVSRGVYSKYNGGAEVVFEVSGYPDRVRVPIYTIVPGDSSMVVKAMLLGLGLVLAGFIVWKLARKVPPPGPRVVTVSNLKDLELTEPAIGAGGFLDASGEALTQGQDAAQSSKPSGQDAARSTGEPPSPAVPPPPRPTGGSGTSGGSWMDNV